jgi:two-component system sensor histidine kinase VicK
MIAVGAIKNERIKAKNRGVQFRYITEITKDNISYCKELSKFAEVRHLNRVKGNFEVSQNTRGKAEYIATATLQEAEPVAQLIYSNVKEIVEQQQFVFDTLWNKAISSEVRIKEIEEGIKPETIEVIVNPKEALETEYKLLESAKQEIQMIFSTVNTFHMQEKQLGITRMLTNLSKQGVNIKVLTPIDNQVKELIANIKEQEEVNQQQPYQNKCNNNTISPIDIQDIAPSSSINAKIIVVDKQDSLVMEIKDGIADSLYATVGLSTLSNSKSTVSSYSAIFENLCKQNQLYKQLKEAYQTVENTNAIQQEFINIAAHELRTPIMPILGYAEMLLEEETDNEKKQTILGIIHNSERLQKLASNILDIAKMESKTFRLYKEPLNLNSVLSQIVKDYKKRLEEQKIRDTTRLISSTTTNSSSNEPNSNSRKGETRLFLQPKVKEDVFIEADKERLTQVICNLLDNAFKFTDKDGSVQIILEERLQRLEEQPKKEEIKQQLGLREQGQQVIISIRDSGTGIDPEILPRLFSKFATKSQRGTGLGLYISKNIVEGHGGTLYAANNADSKGATFTIILPLPEQRK